MFFPYFWVFTFCVQPSGKTSKSNKIWDQRHFNGGSVSKHSFSKFQDFVIPISPKHQEHKAELSETKCKRRRIDFGTRGLLFTRYHSLRKQLLLNNITSWSLTHILRMTTNGTTWSFFKKEGKHIVPIYFWYFLKFYITTSRLCLHMAKCWLTNLDKIVGNKVWWLLFLNFGVVFDANWTLLNQL